MRFNTRLWMGLLALLASNAQAAVKSQDVKYQMAIVEDGELVHEARRQHFGFRVEVVDDSEGVKPETVKNGRPFVTASKGERYSVRLYNPLPVRVGVNLTVDGLNSISGQPSGIADGQKWMIEPFSSITIPGWQVSGGEARRFFFTEKPKTYAKWRGDEMGKDLSANCGVIGAAYFWNQKELDAYYEDHPLYRTSQRPVPYSENRAEKSLSAASGAPACAPRAMGDVEMKKDSRSEESRDQTGQEPAGTGMGEHEYHPTTEVAFDFDRGMYTPSQALVIYYDFAKVSSPNPFPAAGYSPEMP